ncbi:protein phosphatase 2C domain-containing protein [Amycolatopsis nigrescens]|uniref:protein phosphatase 2C domain-containing protein n=1 Tax=Amycolatopsis nigrescens TaxID=381445 RepID=UPI000381760D|nr:protein phosphatase 2C domain-containing protein [Amycolatopsis nigrescens]
MPSPKIIVAEQAGLGADGHPRPTEDHVVVLDNAVLLLDGATAPRPDLPSGGWYASLLAEALAAELRAAPLADLGELLAAAITAVAAAHGLRPGKSPSSTVAMVRWTPDAVDGLVLADSPIVVFGEAGAELLADDRLVALRDSGKLRTGGDVRYQRNAEGGFWVAEADPAAAGRAIRRSWPREEVDAVLLATDGVAVGVDEYRLFDWATVLGLAEREGLASVLDAVRAAELGDPDGARWPRAKRHDDQALVLIRF